MTKRPNSPDTDPDERPLPETCREQIMEMMFDGRGACESRMESILDRIERTSTWKP